MVNTPPLLCGLFSPALTQISVKTLPVGAVTVIELFSVPWSTLVNPGTSLQVWALGCSVHPPAALAGLTKVAPATPAMMSEPEAAAASRLRREVVVFVMFTPWSEPAPRRHSISEAGEPCGNLTLA
jgi:hypothetical protein